MSSTVSRPSVNLFWGKFVRLGLSRGRKPKSEMSQFAMQPSHWLLKLWQALLVCFWDSWLNTHCTIGFFNAKVGGARRKWDYGPYGYPVLWEGPELNEVMGHSDTQYCRSWSETTTGLVMFVQSSWRVSRDLLKTLFSHLPSSFFLSWVLRYSERSWMNLMAMDFCLLQQIVSRILRMDMLMLWLIL